MTMPAWFNRGVRCDYQYQNKDDVLLCTLTGRPCLGGYGGTNLKCLRERWAKEFEAKHGISIFEIKKRELIDAAKPPELA